ncbi:ELAV-like protein 2 [Ylistrum balloti]|uniref:ELAV-like protein 2 n=1 Tax=Ylistrum balloti TaxID=509963 RepID=UPI00290596E1|nr:ELAV-like protein 2 [Ylistrum balloti]XP_060064573.1 ELAV-like protein 2 [Ylistrum balloti]XP_060064574.1 ELAV-like protein 2 [Ylistrum balloti]
MSENQTNLIINYLPQTLTDAEFHSMFASIGNIKSCKIVRDKATNYSYGFGFVDYQSPEDAQRAIQSLNGLQLQNKYIKVALARPGGDSIKGANLYVRNIPRDFTAGDLESIFKCYGEIIQCRVLTDQDTGNSKGVGFILFSQKASADTALAEKNGVPLREGDLPLMIKYAEDNAQKVRPPVQPMYPAGPRGFPGGPMRNMQNRSRYNPMTGGGYGSPGNGMEPHEGYVLFAYNIGPETNEKNLWALFSRYGVVQKVNVIYDHQKGLTKNYGFVTMANYNAAQMAVNCLNGYKYYKGKPLSVSFKN